MATEWFSPEELGARYGIPVGTVYAWRYRGQGPRGHKFGKHVRYSLDDVTAWEAEHADLPAPAA